MLAVVVFRIRCFGREHVPPSGGGLVMSNHQSNMDPVLVGLATNRRLNYLARETLFAFAPFRWLIKSLDAIAIDREGLGLAGLKETLRRLKRGELVLIFPEGTRTRDGEIAPLKSGFCAVARRIRVVAPDPTAAAANRIAGPVRAPALAERHRATRRRGARRRDRAPNAGVLRTCPRKPT